MEYHLKLLKSSLECDQILEMLTQELCTFQRKESTLQRKLTYKNGRFQSLQKKIEKCQAKILQLESRLNSLSRGEEKTQVKALFEQKKWQLAAWQLDQDYFDFYQVVWMQIELYTTDGMISRLLESKDAIEKRMKYLEIRENKRK